MGAPRLFDAEAETSIVLWSFYVRSISFHRAGVGDLGLSVSATRGYSGCELCVLQLFQGLPASQIIESRTVLGSPDLTANHDTCGLSCRCSLAVRCDSHEESSDQALR